MKKRTRKSVSVRAEVFAKLQARATADGVSMAVMLERVLAQAGLVEQIDAPPYEGLVSAGPGIERDASGMPERIRL